MTKVVALAGRTSEEAPREAATEQTEPTAESVLENGDVFITDTGEYVGKWDGAMLSLPMEMSMVVDSYEYLYKLDRREKREGEGS